MQSLPITTDVDGFDSCPGQGVQHNVIKFVSDLQQVSGFPLFRFPPPVKLTATT
jgi:hypothetical protein